MIDLTMPRRDERKGRQYTTLEWAVENTEDNAVREAHLTVSHHRNGIYTTSLRNVTTKTERGFKSSSFMMFSGMKLPSQQIGQRFSAKNLAAAVDQSLALLKEQVATDETVQAYFTPGAVT